MNKRTVYMLQRLVQAGITHEDAWLLRRIAMTLHNWHEQECGSDNGVIERDETTGKPFWRAVHGLSRRFPIPDRETGAKKRLAKIMAAYPALTAYIQTDPRGASLYILRADDIPAGASIDSCYSRGIAVYK